MIKILRLYDRREHRPPVKFEEIYRPSTNEWKGSDSIQTSFEMSVQLNILSGDYEFFVCEDIEGYQYLFRNKKKKEE
jgi:hypothetical protein